MLRVFSTLALAATLVVSAASVRAQPSFMTFETGQVRPMAMNAAGNRLYVVNTPDNQLEIFAVGVQGIAWLRSVPVGLEPCAVAVAQNGDVWVVNHLSDSVSIINTSINVLERVVRTLLVGDEPRDIVMADPDGAGALPQRAFITTAHRGQHRTHTSISSVPGTGDPEFTTEGVGRADVWVFDTGSVGTTIGGTPVEIVELFGDTPRALAVSGDGTTVYAAIFHSGNQTAVVSEGRVCDGFNTSNCSGDGVTSPNGIGGGQLPGGNPGPSTNHAGEDAPEVGLIVQFNNGNGRWEDENNENWSNGIRFFLPDLDVFEIDSDTLSVTDDHAGVGTILFNMAVNPVNGNVYVSNTEAQNLTRFEGPGTFGGSTVQGNLHQSRITVIDNGVVTPRHLNNHINYSVLPAPAGTKNHSLATPVEMAVSADGSTLYVAAFGSSKVGVIPTADLENGTFDPTAESANYLSVSGGGPSGLVLNEARGHLYVLTRFDNSVSVIDLLTDTEINHIPLNNPEPPEVVDGRPFLYDAFNTSSNGEASCSSCHVFGDFDSLAWDLGDPDDDVKDNTQIINLEAFVGFLGGTAGLNGTGNVRDLHPMKGPMTTQTLRGMVNHGHMHWRGDRGSGFCGTDSLGGVDSDLSFKNFILAFGGLVGNDDPVTVADCTGFMQEFTDFALAITLPPNPVRNLDNSLTTDQQNGADFFDGPRLSDGSPILPGAGFTCEGCHTLDAGQGFFGGGEFASFEAETQIVKVPHLRNMYQKVGMFGMPQVPFNINCTVGSPCDGMTNGHLGDQVRGTGFLHDGSTDSIFRFFTATVFNGNPDPSAGFDGGHPQRRDMEEFMLAFDNDIAPIVGQQVTLDATNGATVGSRITLMIQRAGAPFTSQILGGVATECDLVVKGFSAFARAGWLLNTGTGLFESDRTGEAALSDGALRALAGTQFQELTYTCVPPGSGHRIARDRDGDGVMNRDEIAAGTSPDNAGSVAGACNDSIDNDGDGFTDHPADVGCSSAASSLENPQCNDGYDNEPDGQIDMLDPHCSSTWDNREAGGGCGGSIAEVVIAPVGAWLVMFGLLALWRRFAQPV